MLAPPSRRSIAVMCSNFDNVRPRPPQADVRAYTTQLLSGTLGPIETLHAWPRRDAWVAHWDPDEGDWCFAAWHWSLVPFWSDTRHPKMSTFNARAETVHVAGLPRAVARGPALPDPADRLVRVGQTAGPQGLGAHPPEHAGRSPLPGCGTCGPTS